MSETLVYKTVLNYLPISVNHAYYFIKMKTGRVIKVKSKECKEYIEKVTTDIPDSALTEDKLRVHLTFHFPYKNKPKRHDLDNVQKIMLDALSGKIWKDDTQIYHLITKKRDYKADTIQKGVGLTLIEVYKYND